MSLFVEPLFERLLALSPLSRRELMVLVATAPNRYKDHYIEKRNGRGKRLISQPTAELKFLQRLLIDHELKDLPIHEAAVAYRPLHSIADHALPHASARYLMKLDFKDFFPSLRDVAIRHRLGIDTKYSSKEQRILCQLLCRTSRSTGVLQLSIGAPSSPFLSNYLMWEFDSKLSAFCAAHAVRYTRYADDLALSTSIPRLLDSVLAEVRRLIVELSYLGISLNEEKTVNVSKKHKRTLVGLTLSNDGEVSIGRNSKRQLRAEMDALCHDRLVATEVARLRGKLAFIYSIDPKFVMALCARHGFSSVSDVGPKDH